jgi:hypothetical protein
MLSKAAGTRSLVYWNIWRFSLLTFLSYSLPYYVRVKELFIFHKYIKIKISNIEQYFYFHVTCLFIYLFIYNFLIIRIVT